MNNYHEYINVLVPKCHREIDQLLFKYIALTIHAMNNRIVRSNSVGQIANLIRDEFRNVLPVSLRGILTSLERTIDLAWSPHSTRSPNGWRINPITETLERGCEYNPADVSYIVRVSEFPPKKWDPSGGVVWNYASPHKICELRGYDSKGNPENVLQDIRTAVLVYDKKLLRTTGGFNINERFLPTDPELLRKIILRAYVIDERCEYCK